MAAQDVMFGDEPPQEEPVRVCLRLRPVSKFELSRRSTNCVTTSHNEQHKQQHAGQKASYATMVEKGLNKDEEKEKNDGIVVDNRIRVDSPTEGEFNFAFDSVLDEHSSQSAVYRTVAAPLAPHAMDGYDVALVAYGQTGSGKTYTMMGGQGGYNGGSVGSGIGSSSKTTARSPKKDERGMIQLLVKDVFRLMNESPPTIEYVVRCSFVEIYLEKVLDLLNPVNRNVRVLSGSARDAADDGTRGGIGGGGGGSSGGGEGGIRLQGASEACCLDESDVVSLLVRGNACRTVSSTKMNNDSSRSHAIFVMRIEQRDGRTGITKASQLSMIDMAGSELGGKDEIAEGTRGAAIHQEARMINKSLSLLHTVVRTVVENQKTNTTAKGAAAAGGGGGLDQVPYRQSKLTHLLRDAFGGNCRTAVILAASPASYNISETIRTLKFGRLCQSVKNHVRPSVEMSPLDYRKLLNDSQQKQSDLLNLVNELSSECFQLKQDAKNRSFVESHYDGPLWKTIEAIIVSGATPAVVRANKSGRGTSGGGGTDDAKEELSRTSRELENMKIARENLENLLAERQSEVAVLRTQNDNYSSEKKRDAQEIVSMKNEMHLLTQRKQEVEHNLRTSQFREYEATVFLRQFRRFYRRLLRNKAHQGTGRTSEVIERVPGVPDLNDLIDVDSLLLEAGLIEESELHDDTATGAYRPSAQALGRSTDATNKAWKEAALHGKVDELESFDRSSFEEKRSASVHHRSNSDGGADAGAGVPPPHGQSISYRQQFLGTPAGRLTTMRERELERDVLRATERCIELQVALNEEKANVDVLTNRAGNLNRMKFKQEEIQLKQQLDKKTHDLQAIIWKMNELHLINKTYNEKMSNREQHVTYLEENLVELQSSNRNMIHERQEAEGHLRGELDNLKVLVDAMTVPLWQFGECGVSGQTLASRIRLPVCGGDFGGSEIIEDDGSGESLESLEESVLSSDDEEDGEDESEGGDELEVSGAMTAPVQITEPRKVPTQDASIQAMVSQCEKATMTDTIVASQPPPRFTSKDDVSNASTLPSRQGFLSSNSSTPAVAADGIIVGDKKNAQIIPSVDVPNDYMLSEHLVVRCGKPAGSHPRRSVHKFGLMIRPGVLKESSSKGKSERAARSVKA